MSHPHPARHTPVPARVPLPQRWTHFLKSTMKLSEDDTRAKTWARCHRGGECMGSDYPINKGVHSWILFLRKSNFPCVGICRKVVQCSEEALSYHATSLGVVYRYGWYTPHVRVQTCTHMCAETRTRVSIRNGPVVSLTSDPCRGPCVESSACYTSPTNRYPHPRHGMFLLGTRVLYSVQHTNTYTHKHLHTHVHTQTHAHTTAGFSMTAECTQLHPTRRQAGP